MSGLLGAIAMSPIEITRSLSKTGRYVVPWFVVFQMPLVAAATKNVPVPGMPSMSVTRPAMFAGPIDRHSICSMKASSATACCATAGAGRVAAARTDAARMTGSETRFSMVRGSWLW